MRNLIHLTNKKSPRLCSCSVLKHAVCGRARKKCRGKHKMQSTECFSPLLECYTAFFVSYNRTEHSRVVFICFMIKNSTISIRIRPISRKFTIRHSCLPFAQTVDESAFLCNAERPTSAYTQITE